MKTGILSARFPGSLFLLTVLLLLGGCVTGKQTMQNEGLSPLTTSDLQGLFAEQRVAKWSASKTGHTYQIEYFPDGSMKAAGGGKTYSGTYTLKNDEFCPKMEGWSSERCETYFKTGDNQYKVFARDGSLNGILSFSN